MLPHPLTNYKIQKYFPNEPMVHDTYSKNNSPKIKDGVYLIVLDE